MKKTLAQLEAEAIKRTPQSQLRASRKHRAKLTKKTLTLNPDKPHERALIEALENEPEPFAGLMKKLLADHYNIDAGQ